MLCERKLRARKVDKRQTGIEVNPTIQRRCGTEMTPTGMYGFACTGCGRIAYRCQACNTITDSINRHFTDKETGRRNACYRNESNQPFRQLMASLKKP